MNELLKDLKKAFDSLSDDHLRSIALDVKKMGINGPTVEQYLNELQLNLGLISKRDNFAYSDRITFENVHLDFCKNFLIGAIDYSIKNNIEIKVSLRKNIDTKVNLGDVQTSKLRTLITAA